MLSSMGDSLFHADIYGLNDSWEQTRKIAKHLKQNEKRYVIHHHFSHGRCAVNEDCTTHGGFSRGFRGKISGLTWKRFSRGAIIAQASPYQTD
jgi:hypothetical protein